MTYEADGAGFLQIVAGEGDTLADRRRDRAPARRVGREAAADAAADDRRQPRSAGGWSRGCAAAPSR